MNLTTLPRNRHAAGIAAHAAGAGAPVVLVHGVGLRAESWAPQVHALAPRFEVHAVDMPGHGHSARLPASAPALGDFTDALARYLHASLAAPAVIAGHSMGALLALDLATRHPALCRGVMALSAVYRRTPRAARAVRARAAEIAHGAATGVRQDLASGPVARWFGDPPAAHEREPAALCRAWLEHGDVAGYAAAYTVFAHHDGPPDDALRTLGVPAAFVTGEHDANSTPAMARAMAALAPASAVAIVAGARHMAQMTHPDEVLRALLALASRCG